MAEPTGPAVLWLALGPKTFGDAEKLGRGLQQMIAEDAALRMRSDAATGDVMIGAMDDQHLEVIVDRLRREFGVEATCGRPQVAYKETITRPAEGEAACERTGGLGPSGHVRMHLSPGARGSGYVFEGHLAGGALPEVLIRSVDNGIRDALSVGPVKGYPVDDVHVELWAGSYHDAHSTEDGFRNAASIAFQEAARKAGPVVLEPAMRLDVVVPTAFIDDVMQNIESRSGHIQSREDRVETQAIRARVPLADLFGYGTDLRSRTYGRGTYSVQFEQYVPVSPPGSDYDRDALVGAPLKPAPKLRESGIALPEPGELPGDAV
ncbi:MAG TPA: hypothetical protein VNJ04_20725 [Gemmatimonadaceae bacterium]|nr:hypothetical protein [Gemmatimonadaceae bacterium]